MDERIAPCGTCLGRGRVLSQVCNPLSAGSSMPRYCRTRSMKAWKSALGGGAKFSGSESFICEAAEYEDPVSTP